MKAWTGVIAHFGLAAGGMVIALLFSPPIFSGDYDTARNYLSTIAATLATILALCISIVLVAIQMTASKYSTRVIDFFIRLPYNASLLSLYLITIFHSIYILSKVQHTPGILPFWLDRAMSADLFLVGFCLVALLSYLFAVLRLMKPETILLTIEREYFNCYNRGLYQDAIDKLEQIADIGKRSLADLDTMTGHLCVTRLSYVLSKIKIPIEQSSPVFWYHRKVIRLLLSLASIAYEKREVTVSSAVLDELEQIGERYLEGESLPGIYLLADSYKWIVTNNLLGSQQQDIIQRVIDLLYDQVYAVLQDVQETKFKEGFQFVETTLHSLYELGKKVAQSESYGAGLVVDLFLTHRYSRVISQIYQGNAWSEDAENLAFALSDGFFTLASSLLPEMRAGDMILITSWIRTLLLDAESPPKPKLFYKKMFILLMASALCQGRRDLLSISIRAIGKYIDPDINWFNDLLNRRLQIRVYFDYREPEPYLREVYQLWKAFKQYTEKLTGPPAVLQVIELGNPGRQTRLNDWPELFETK